MSFGHALSSFDDFHFSINSRFKDTSIGIELEEGIVESFTQNAWKYYFTNHEESIDGSKIDNLLYLSSTYRTYVSLAKTLMAKDSSEGGDKDIFRNYLFGDKELAYKSLDVKKLLRVCKEHIEITPELLNLLLSHLDFDFYEESYRDNNILIEPLRAIRLMPREEQGMYLELLNNFVSVLELSNSNDIENSIQFDSVFNKRKLYNISSREFDLVLLDRELISYDMMDDYLSRKVKELTNDEEKEYSPTILQNILTILMHVDDEYNAYINPNKILSMITFAQERSIQSAVDLQKEIELCKFLSINCEMLSNLHQKPTNIEGLSSFFIDKIKTALLNPEIASQMNGVYCFKDFIGCKELQEALLDSGIEIKHDKEIIEDVCLGIEKSKSTISDFETTSHEFEEAFKNCEKGGAEINE